MASPLSVPLPWDLVASAYAEDVVPIFDRFARAALELARVVPGQHVVDVACGPGTLAVRAAQAGAQVAAIDFAPNMIAGLRARVALEGLAGISAEVGDGQALPYADASFDAGFSLFGLMFFPDRAAGFRELHRVLRPGARVVVSSWHPLDQVPLFEVAFGTLATLMRARDPDAQAPPPPRFPLIEADDYHREMGVAGFRDIAVTNVASSLSAPSTADLWSNMQRTNAPLVLLQQQLGAAWMPIAAQIGEALEVRFGSGPQTVVLPAMLGTATV